MKGPAISRSLFSTIAAIASVLTTGACGFSGPGAKTSLREVCSVPDAELAAIRSGPFLEMENAQETIVHLSKTERYALLEMPGCRLTPLADGPRPRGGLASPMQVTPGGARLFSTYDAGRPAVPYWYAPSEATAPMEVCVDATASGPEFPILSEDGGWLAVLRTTRTREESRNEIVLREANGSGRRSVWPAQLEWTWHELVAIDVIKKQVVLSRGLREYIWVDFAGKTIRGPVNTGTVRAQPNTFRWVGDGWFAWDAYRDQGPYGFRLSLSARDFSASVEKLRMISHAAVSPGARYAAASLENAYARVLSWRDAVVVYDTASGQEIFREYLPPYTRTQVAFLGAEHFAYDEPGRVRVIALPK